MDERESHLTKLKENLPPKPFRQNELIIAKYNRNNCSIQLFPNNWILILF